VTAGAHGRVRRVVPAAVAVLWLWRCPVAVTVAVVVEAVVEKNAAVKGAPLGGPELVTGGVRWTPPRQLTDPTITPLHRMGDELPCGDRCCPCYVLPQPVHMRTVRLLTPDRGMERRLRRNVCAFARTFQLERGMIDHKIAKDVHAS